MKTNFFFKRIIFSAILIVSIFFLNANNSDGIEYGSSLSSCVSTNYDVLWFGVRLHDFDEPYYLDVSAPGTWGAYVSDSWIKINGGSTISSGGSETIIVTVCDNYCVPVPSYGTITIYGPCGGMKIIHVNYGCTNC